MTRPPRNTVAFPFFSRQEASAGGCLSIRDVCKTYDPDGAAWRRSSDCSLEVSAGEFVAIVGPSGCGKSTLLNAIAGFDTVSGGEIYHRWPASGGAGLPAAAGPGPGRRVPERRALSVEDRCSRTSAMARCDRRLSPASRHRRRPSSCCARAAASTLSRGSYPAQLSSGMQRRVEIVRALMNEPKVLLLDEPFRAMDTVSKATMHQHLLDMYRMCRKTIVFITHDLEEAIYLADTVIVMTTRPATIKLVIAVKLQQPRHPKMLFSHEYLELKREAAESIHEEARKAFERGEREQA